MQPSLCPPHSVIESLQSHLLLNSQVLYKASGLTEPPIALDVVKVLYLSLPPAPLSTPPFLLYLSLLSFSKRYEGKHLHNHTCSPDIL